jgi:hypothetical protein
MTATVLTRPAPSVQSESSDAYAYVVAVLNDRWRVIECAAGIQWILQRREGIRHGRTRWEARGYFRTSEALIVACRALVAEIDPQACITLAALPGLFPEGKLGETPLAPAR